MSITKWMKIIGMSFTFGLILKFGYHWFTSIQTHGYVRFVVHEYSPFWFVLEGMLLVVASITSLIGFWEVANSG